MTVTSGTSSTSTPGGAPVPPELVTVTIDGLQTSVPKGTLVIRAAELIGIQIPRFCDHPLLDPVGACRQCLVEVSTPGPNGSLRPMPKPQVSCAQEVTPGMVVKTQHSSPVADKAQQGIMEFLLINHPLDCPVCDKGGECPLQNQAMSNGRATSRFHDPKRTFPKPVKISTQVLLDRERCIQCQRCTRFSKEIAGDAFIELMDRGPGQQIGTFSPGRLGFHTSVSPSGDALEDTEGQPFTSYFSGNTIQICPVGALTSAAYRFRSRPFDLVSAPGICELCASGCAIRTDHRRGTVLRRLAGDDPAVNEEWTCDKGRFAFRSTVGADRLTHPLVRDHQTGELVPASWPDALEAAARGLRAARADAGGRGVGVLTGGQVSVEDAYAYSKFARMCLGTNDIDFRFRAHSAEEESFLAAAVAGRGVGVTYRDLESAPAVLLAGFEPEEESPIVFLRLRKAVRKRGQVVIAIAPMTTRGLTKLSGIHVPAAPGTEPEVLDAIAEGRAEVKDTTAALRQAGAVLLVGERLAAVPGGLSAALRLAAATGATLAWVPRRSGERGALEAGALPGLLPGGRPVQDAPARVDVGAVWGSGSLPTQPGRDTAGILAAAAAGELSALLVGGIDPTDLPDPHAATAALSSAGFVVSLEVRASEVTRVADVVLPVAPVAEKAGSFVDWEGRWRTFEAALESAALPDLRVLDLLAGELDAPIGLPTAAVARAELAELGPWEGQRSPSPQVSAGEPPAVEPGQAVLATWRLLLDLGRAQDGEPYLAGTAHRAVARLSANTAAEIGVADGQSIRVATQRGSIVLPLLVADLPDRVVWVPSNSVGSQVGPALRATAGDVVTIAAAESQVAPTAESEITTPGGAA